MYQEIPDSELKKYGKTWSLSKKAIALVNHQKANWQLAGNNYRALKSVRESSFRFGHFTVKVQFNPERIRSSAANTSPDAIRERPCFLCPGNLPPEQYCLPVTGNFTLLTNPFPIFPYHLTIPFTGHIPQLLKGKIDDLLEISRLLSDFVVFYNGPLCGASAPDHLHFQAGIRDILPVEEELDNLISDHSDLIFRDETTLVCSVENYLRRFIAFRSASEKSLHDHLSRVTGYLPQSENQEPMMNILAWYNSPEWTVILFPRQKQRPWQYFAGDFDQLLISPAAVELGGLVVLPREEDFYKLTEKDLISVYDQVTISKENFAVLKEKIITSVE